MAHTQIVPQHTSDVVARTVAMLMFSQTGGLDVWLTKWSRFLVVDLLGACHEWKEQKICFGTKPGLKNDL